MKPYEMEDGTVYDLDKKITITITDIDWDAPKSIGLPNEVVIDINISNVHLLEDIDGSAENLSDYLSDTYEYCHYGFTAEVEIE